MNHVDLRPQAIYAGAVLVKINILVCNICYDVPNETTRAIVIPADPVPIINPRVEPFFYDETTGQTTAVGPPLGLEQAAIMPLYGTTHYGVQIPLLSVSADGTTTIHVTTRGVHGLATNDQISVEGLANPRACGFYSVTVTTATAFSYIMGSSVAAGPLLTETTRLVTALVGLPYGVTQIPVVTP